ncbi:Retrovirus-related Pol polyprotein from type-1 retrotransposable element [Trichinella sp. T8]|nr:Retrovirus-related Pol polyprotein from type-1 retrotransposable element [Trichinella sp. T8]
MSCDLIKEATGMATVDINELQNNIRKVFSSGRKLPMKFHGARETVQKKMAKPRVVKFKRFQRLFRSNRRKLYSHIFDKTSLEQFGGSIDEASDHLEKFLSRPRLESDSYSVINDDKSIRVAHPILAEETSKLNSYDLATLFNLWLKSGDLPESVKASRTIFLPKSDGTTDISNCRPITIASALYRLFSKIITRLLAARLELNVRQKAFRPEMNGVFETTAILYALIKDAKVRSKEICIATLDFAKAFDSVPHSRILRALRKNNVDSESVDLISKMLTGKMTPCLPSFKKGSLVNSWLRGNSGMCSQDYITGLKLRFRVIETRSQKWRGRTPQNPDALLFAGTVVTLQDTGRQPQMSHRMHAETAIKSGDDVYKPDLILIKDDTAHIIDVAVPWEKGTNMHERHEPKSTKYAQLTEDVKALFGVHKCTEEVIVIGARSSWCLSNDRSLKACGLHLPKKFKRLLCRCFSVCQKIY